MAYSKLTRFVIVVAGVTKGSAKELRASTGQFKCVHQRTYCNSMIWGTKFVDKNQSSM
jgi:hypothetical protein